MAHLSIPCSSNMISSPGLDLCLEKSSEGVNRCDGFLSRRIEFLMVRVAVSSSEYQSINRIA